MRDQDQLKVILRKWRSKQYLIALLILVLAFVISYLFKAYYDLNINSLLFSLTIISIFVLGLFYYFSPKKIDLVNLINTRIKGTEHSTHLLEKPNSELSILQRIQKCKVVDAIDSANIQLPFLKKPILLSVGFSILSLLSLGLVNNNADTVDTPADLTTTEGTVKESVTRIEKDTLILNDVSIRITPPAYTGKKSYYNKDLSLNIPERSTVNWKFDLSGSVHKKQIIFDDKTTKPLSANNAYGAQFSNPSFYQYRFEGNNRQEIISDYYPIKIIEDASPQVKISGVEEYQRLDFQEEHKINFTISSEDDYGLNTMLISATLAKGSGESVKFREKQIDIKDLTKGSRTYQGTYQFSTKELEMEPGDELYFYVAAKDNCPFENHWSKSTTHFVVLEDTAAVALVDAGGMQMDLMPDFFRSQRQIIIDTEKLFAEKDTLPKEIFNERSNELGYDQKLLRLKYGQFLGEEAESGLDFDNDVEIDAEGEPIDHSDPNHVHEDDGSKALNDARSLIDQFMHDHDHEEEEGQLLETKGTEKIEEAKNPQWVKDMSHSHDNVEEATFFDVSIKSKLRAALNEMWDSELHLRLFDPEKSLPFQYASLAFLDEVKNHARAYVQRIGFEPPAIKEQEKRLTGELKEIYSTRDILKTELNNSKENIKASLPILLDLQGSLNNIELASSDVNILEKAGAELSQIAIQKAEYLPVLSNLRTLIHDPRSLSEEQLNIILQGFLNIIPKDKNEAVAKEYFRHPINVKVINDFKKTR